MPDDPVRSRYATSPEGVAYRDLNHNGVMDPYEDPWLPVDARVEDLIGTATTSGRPR